MNWVEGMSLSKGWLTLGLLILVVDFDTSDMMIGWYSGFPRVLKHERFIFHVTRTKQVNSSLLLKKLQTKRSHTLCPEWLQPRSLVAHTTLTLEGGEKET